MLDKQTGLAQSLSASPTFNMVLEELKALEEFSDALESRLRGIADNLYGPQPPSDQGNTKTEPASDSLVYNLNRVAREIRRNLNILAVSVTRLEAL